MTALLLFLFGAMAISFLCSILEASLMSTPISYVTMREEEGYKPASKFKVYKQDSSRPIAAILSLNTIANTIGAAGVGQQANILFGSRWFALVSVIVTILILVFSEIIPKTIGATRWKSLMGFTTACISFLIFIMYPIVVCIEWLQKHITPKDSSDTTISRDEVSAMANVAEEEGDLEEDENAIIQNLINMDDVTAADVMTPRVVAHIAPERMTIKSFYRDKRYLHHSRIPVFADNDEYITGYILRMEALQLMAEDKPPLCQLWSFIFAPCMSTMPLPVFISLVVSTTPSSSATITDAVLNTEPGSSRSLTALFFTSRYCPSAHFVILTMALMSPVGTSITMATPT